MVGRYAEQPVDRPMSLQRWTSLTFVHWSYPPADVEALLPQGLTADLHEGRAWVSLTPFVMTRVRLPGLPPMPGLSRFPEINVRTYVRDRTGRDGLFFLTLECTRSALLGARTTLQLPYAWAQMSVEQRDDAVRYTSTRRLPSDGSATLDLTVRPGPAITDDNRTARDDWLTGRWRAFMGRATVRAFVNVAHEPWSLQHATITQLHGDLVASTGLPEPEGEPVVHYSAGVDVRLDRPRRV